jgi:hypothetical protein
VRALSTSVYPENASTAMMAVNLRSRMTIAPVIGSAGWSLER